MEGTREDSEELSQSVIPEKSTQRTIPFPGYKRPSGRMGLLTRIYSISGESPDMRSD